MTRLLVAAIHGMLGAMTLVGTCMFLFQVRLNLAWETGLYGEVSPLTIAAVIAVVIGGAVGVVQAIASIGWAMNQRWGGLGLLGVSVVLLAVSGGAMRFLVLAGMVSIAAHLFLPPRQAAPPEPGT